MTTLSKITPVYLRDLADHLQDDMRRDMREQGYGEVLDQACAEERDLIVGYYIALEEVALEDA